MAEHSVIYPLATFLLSSSQSIFHLLFLPLFSYIGREVNHICPIAVHVFLYLAELATKVWNPYAVQRHNMNYTLTCHSG